MEGGKFAQLLTSLDKTKKFFSLSLSIATDLAHHFRIRKELDAMVASGYDKGKKRHKQLLLSLLMTSCDLSDQAKDWKNSKNIAVSRYIRYVTPK